MKKYLIRLAFNENPVIKQFMESIGFIAKTVDGIDVYWKQDGDYELKVTSGTDKRLLPVDDDQLFHFFMIYHGEEEKNDEHTFATFADFQNGWGNILNIFKDNCEGDSDEQF